MDLSTRIVQIRKQMGLSQEKFGELVNMSQRSVAAWESGDRTPLLRHPLRSGRQAGRHRGLSARPH